jgi:hypothetical protein
MELHISMIPSPQDPPCRSADYQSELRNLGLTLKADGLEIRDVGLNSARSGCTSVSGEWRIPLSPTLGPALEAPVGSWLQGRRGRTVRLIIGETEADVRTIDELVNLIKIARSYQDVADSSS